MRCHSQQLDPQKTVFVGALHGMLNAEGLCNIFNDLFGGVIYASTKEIFDTKTSFEKNPKTLELLYTLGCKSRNLGQF